MREVCNWFRADSGTEKQVVFMAQAHHDSSFELTLLPIEGRDPFAPESDNGKVTEIPMLSLDSSDPLPTFDDDHLPTIEASFSNSPSLAALSLLQSANGSRAAGSLWLQGDVLMCPCPDCSALKRVVFYLTGVFWPQQR